MIPCLSIVRIYKKFGIQIFEIDFVIEKKIIFNSFPLPRAPGGRAKNDFAAARSKHGSNSYAKFG